MPFLRRRAKLRTEPPEGAPRTREHLLTGHDWPALLEGPDLDPEQLRAAWFELRDTLMAEHLRRHPRSRPWAWWTFESPEPRRQVIPGPEADRESGLWFGMPRLHRGWPPDGMYESEKLYLERLGLTQADE